MSKRRRQPRLQDLRELGWNREDLFQERFTMFGAPMGAKVMTPKEREKAEDAATAGLGELPPITIQDPFAPGGTANGIAGAMPFAATLLPNEQAEAQEYMRDPQGFAKQRVEQRKQEGWLEQGKTLMSRVFDIEDPEKETIVESVFDNTLQNLFWTFDRIAQTGSYSYAKAEQYNPTRALGYLTEGGLLDAGVPELTWEEAGKISFGQLVSTAGSQLSRQLGGPEFGPMGAEGFNIKSEEQRYKAFQEDLYGKWSSGIVDAVFTVFTDPMIYAGWGLKAARVRYVDRPVKSQAQIDDFSKKIGEDVRIMESGGAPKTSQGQFIDWVMQKDPKTGQKVVRANEIYEHPAIRWSGNRDALTAGFFAASTRDEAALFMRSAYGDVVARQELLTKRADLALELGNAEKNLVANKIAFNPSSFDKQIRRYDQRVAEKQAAYKAAQEEQRLGRMTAEQVDELFVDYKQALEIRKSIDDIDIRSVEKNPVTESELQVTKDAFNELKNRDEWLRRALDEDITGALLSANKTFSAGNPFGRLVESSRQSRAVTAARTKAVNTAPWKHDVYYNVGGLQRTVNVWRWLWAEKPNGYFSIRGVSGNEQGREMLATLNQVPIYNGIGKEVLVDGQLQTVGGVGRKQQLFEEYLAASGSGTRSENYRALTLDRIEQQIMNDIAAFYGLPKAEAQLVYKIASRERAELFESIKNRKFFVEEVPNASGGKEIIYHAAPYLESQLENGTYFLNFSMFSKLARRRAEELKKGADPMTDEGLRTLDLDQFKTAAAFGRDYGSQKAMNLYNSFNDLWRPVTLLRLGYVQRNLAEGLFRSVAFTESLAPLGGATMQASYAVRNAVVKRNVQRDLRKLDKKFAGTAVPTERFKKWRSRQEEAIDMEILQQSKHITDMEARLKQLDTTNQFTVDTENNLVILAAQLDELKRFRDDFISDDEMALAYYRKQGAAKRRLYDGTSMVDGIQYRGAFANDEYTPIALANLSSDPTIKMSLSLRDRNATNSFRALETKYYVDVRPENGEAYWDGVANMLRQFRSSEVGLKVIRGEDPESIARWLVTDKTGREIAEFVTGNVQSFASGTAKAGKKQKKRTVSKGGFDTSDYDGALGYVETLYSRLEQLAPNPKLVELLRNVDVQPKDIRRLLDTEEYRGALQPAVGNIAKEVGLRPFRETWRGWVNKAFEVFGTMPEDTFVRTPFYGMRYAEVRDTLIRNLSDYYSDLARQQGIKPDNMFIPLSEINRAHRVAHRRALKDTKDWLYTIDRRTNLGHYGEYIHPFITSAQNGITAVGRLVWRNPALPEYMRLVWQAPQQMGIEDDKGNIVVGIPLQFVPQGIKDTLGLDNILNIKIPKNGLNVIFPESGFGIIPRFGPVVGVPVAELMKSGFFGLAPAGYTPDWLKVIGEDNATAVWNTWRDYVFGEDRGPSTEFASWDLITPPTANRLIQLVLGFNSRTFASTYVKIEQSELLKAGSNLREDVPTADEIESKTRWHIALRFLGNATAFTPPQYQFLGEPLVDARRMYDRNIPQDADKAFYEQFGALATIVTDISLSKNVAGVDPTDVAVERANKYPKLVREISSNVNDLNVLGIVLNGDPSDEYNPAAVSWQAVSRIPGTSREYRETLDPIEAKNDAFRKNGWIKYLQFVEGQDAILESRGLKSYRDKRAQDLVENRRRFIAAAQNNPSYNAWYRDYVDFGSTRTLSAITALNIALNDERYVTEESSSTLEAARIYISKRNEIIRAVQQSGQQSLRTKKNQELAEYWDRFRTDLINRYSKWGIVANRYLSGDDDPMNPGIQWWQVADTYDQGIPDVPEASTMGTPGGYLTSGSSEEMAR